MDSRTPAFSERELDVMTVLWDRGPATVAEVRDALAEGGLDLAYNTVLTVLRILEDKGRITHAVDGRAHRYRPMVARADAEAGAVRRLVRTLFRGSPELLMTHLVRDPAATPETVRRLRALLDAEHGAAHGAARDAATTSAADTPRTPQTPQTSQTSQTPLVHRRGRRAR